MSKYKKILVTGAGGFIGSHVVEAAAAKGIEVKATDLRSTLETDHPIRKYNPMATKLAAAEVLPGDITNPADVKKMVSGVEAIIHVASVFSYTTPWEVLYRVNVQGTINLLEAAAAEGIKKVVVIGAGGVYGVPQGKPFTEDDPPDPPNNYLKSKWFEEWHVMNLSKRLGYKYSILRPTTVYGPRQSYGGIQILEMGANNKVVSIPSNFTARVPFIHVHDVAGAAVHCLDAKKTSNEIFNINDDSSYTTIEVMRLVAAAFNRPFLVTPPVPIGTVRDIMMFVAGLDDMIAKGIGRKVTNLEKDMLGFLGADFTYTNDKIKGTGYTFKYPDPKQGLLDTTQWYKETGIFK